MRIVWLVSAAICFSFFPKAAAQVPALLHYQGRVLVGSTAFEGQGQFKFSFVNRNASQVFWRSSPDSNNDGQPDLPVMINVSKGLYGVLLGDTSLANMAALPAVVFASGDVYLRVWFNNGQSGFQLLSPDQRIASVGYAMMAANVPDGSITASKFAPDALQASNLVGALSPSQLPAIAAAVQVSSSPSDAGFLGLGYVSFTSIPAPPWANGSTEDMPSARVGHAAIWVGTLNQMFVWGGQLAANTYSASGGLYSSNADQWHPVTPVGAPEARRGHTMIWDGNAAVVWGGFAATGFLNTGGRFQLNTLSWSALSTANAPVARDGHIAVWLAPYMVIWGGRNSGGLRNDGTLYNSTSDQWTPLSVPNPPTARSAASAVVTTDRALIWGGSGIGGALNTGAQLIFQLTPSVAPVEWRPISTVNAPSPRTGHTAVLAGTKMIIWGGKNGGSFLGDGAIYDSIADTWQTLPSTGAPAPRANHTAVWTGEEMIVLGGETASGATSNGAAFNLVASRWRTLTTAGGAVGRDSATTVWTGTELLTFGGQAGGIALASLQRLIPQPTWYLYRKL